MDAMSSNKILPGSCAAAGFIFCHSECSLPYRLSSAIQISFCHTGSLLSLILLSLFSHPDLFPLAVQSISIPVILNASAPVILIVPFPVILSEAKDLLPLHHPYFE